MFCYRGLSFILSQSILFSLLLSRGKVALDGPNSKYIILDPAVVSPAALPEHLRAAGEFKGTIKEVELADAVTFRVVMTTGKLFEAKVRRV